MVPPTASKSSRTSHTDIMAGELIFVTGAAGFVGAHAVEAALEAGYRVRGSVRREAQAEQLRNYFNSKAAEFVIVRDITKPGAYDGVLEGVDYIFHVASPLPAQTKNYKKDVIEPAVLGTTTILEAASKIPSVKKVVLTGSVIDLVPMSFITKGGVVVEDPKEEVTANADDEFENPFLAYRASKVLAQQAAHKFMAEKKPHFSLASIHPVTILGRNLLQTSPDDVSGTNADLWYSLIGPKQTIPGSFWVHVRDVADLHVKALRPDLPSGEKFLASAGSLDWDEVRAFVKERYPLVQQGEAEGPRVLPIDASKAERVLGMKWRNWQEAVTEVVDQQLGLSKL
ncbi:3-beta hydroxysteroid dehydrogenase/isomerase family protein [Phyllosticta paracitricarpa]